MKKQGILILVVLFIGTMGLHVVLAEEETARPLPSDEEFLAPFSLGVRGAFFELSQEEREAIKSKNWDKDSIAEVITLKDDFVRKYRLGIDEVQKFFRAEEKRKEPIQKLQRERLDRISVPKGNPIKYVINKDCVVIGTVKEIQEHPEGPYHTWVIIAVEQYLKGGSGEKEVIVKMIHGPVEFMGEMGGGVGQQCSRTHRGSAGIDYVE